MGHSFQAVSLLVEAAAGVVAVPLVLRPPLFQGNHPALFEVRETWKQCGVPLMVKGLGGLEAVKELHSLRS